MVREIIFVLESEILVEEVYDYIEIVLIEVEDEVGFLFVENMMVLVIEELEFLMI